jgi:hypothetical protein
MYAYLQRRQQGKYNVIQKFFFLHLYQMSLSETSKGELRTLLERDVEPLSDDIIIPKLDVERFADDNTFLEQDVEHLSDDILIPKLDDEPLDDDCMLQKIVVDFLLMTTCFCNKMTTPLLMTTSFWN